MPPGFGLAILAGACRGHHNAIRSGGDPLQGALRGAISARITAGLFYGAGVAIKVGELVWAQQAVLHAAAGLASGAAEAAITGGTDIQQATIISAVSAGVAKGIGVKFGGGPGAQVAAGMIAGGITSSMSGGDFAEGVFRGAWTSVMAHIFNHMMSEYRAARAMYADSMSNNDMLLSSAERQKGMGKATDRWARKELTEHLMQEVEWHRSEAEKYYRWAEFHTNMAEQIYSAFPPTDGRWSDILPLVMTEASRQMAIKNYSLFEFHKVQQRRNQEALNRLIGE